MAFLQQVAVIVNDYDEAIDFFVGALDFDLVEDSPALTNDGRGKRWVTVRPRGATTALLLAQADGEDQRAVVGEQFAGRVGFFLEVDDFDAHHRRMLSRGVQFLTSLDRSSTGALRCSSMSPATSGTYSASSSRVQTFSTCSSRRRAGAPTRRCAVAELTCGDLYTKPD